MPRIAVLRASIAHRSMPILRALICAVATVAWGAANAAEGTSSSAVQWQCQQEYDAYYHVRCIAQPLQSGAKSNPAVVTSAAAVQATAGYDLRPVVMRGAQAVYSAQGWRVPLYTQPSDTTTVAHLLKSVLCDTAPQCSVQYSGVLSARN